MKMRNLYDPLKHIGRSAVLILGAATLLTSCSEKYDIKGKLTNDRLWEVPGFGHLYRVEVEYQEGHDRKVTPFVFVGSYEELKSLDDKFNVGDDVNINSKSTAISLSGETVLVPTQIKKAK